MAIAMVNCDIFNLVSIKDAAGKGYDGTELTTKEIEDSFWRILKENMLCSVATVMPNCQAHINTVFYSYTDDLDLFFLSHPNSQHCRNLKENPSMAVTIFSSQQIWAGSDQGLQLFGLGGEIFGRDLLKAERSYGDRFPGYMAWRKDLHPPDLGLDYHLYRFQVVRAKVYDEKTWKRSVFAEVDVIR